MDNTIVSQSFLTAPREVLAAQLALLDQTTLAKLMKSKAADLLSKEKGEFNRIVEESASSLMAEQPGELVLRMFGALNGILGIAPRRYAAPRDFDDNCDEILSRCLIVLRESEPEFTGADLQDMLRFLMNKMFGEIGKRFESLGSDKQQQVVDAVRKFIDGLPEAQREKLRNEIGADQVTDSYIRKALVAGTLSGAFATAVSVGGFAFYTGAVSLLASLAGLVGLTLPFSAYIGLTSTIAVIANPVFFIPFVAGGGWWLYSRQNHKMRRRLAPLVVAQSVLAQLAGRTNSLDHSDDALDLWQSAWTLVEQSRINLTQAETALAATREELLHTEGSIRVLNERQAQVSKDQETITSKVKTQCTASARDIARSTWGSNVREAGQCLQRRLDAVEACRNRGVRGGVSGVLDRIGRSVDTRSAEQKADSSARAAASAVIEGAEGGASMYPTDVRDLVHQYAASRVSRKEIGLELSETRQKKSRLERQESVEERHRSECHSERDRAEARYWGLSEIK